MNDHDFMRYSRQLLLEDIAIEGQQKLLASRVLIIGMAAGLPGGALSGRGWRRDADTADDDAVHLNNLQRRILFTQRGYRSAKSRSGTDPAQPAKPAESNW